MSADPRRIAVFASGAASVAPIGRELKGSEKAPGSQVVLFDLFGTLVPGGSGDERDTVSRLIADDLGVDPEEFASLVRVTYDERMRGTLGDLRDTLARLANQLGADPTPESLEVAAQRRLLLTRRLLSKTWAVPALQALTAASVQVGVVSDCSAETPETGQRVQSHPTCWRRHSRASRVSASPPGRPT